jgi:LysR family transcriptional regulator for metE and metH
VTQIMDDPRVELTETIIEMVKAGLGIGVMARWAVTPQIESGSLVGVPLTAKGLHRHWNAAMIKHKAAPPYLLKFVELRARPPTDFNIEKQSAC